MTVSRSGADRRPWLILSAREARAFLQHALGEQPDFGDLARAVRITHAQLVWLSGEPGNGSPESEVSEETLKERACGSTAD